MRKLMRLSGDRWEFASARAVCASTALHGVHGAPKLRKDAVARRIGYAAPVIPNELIEDRSALGEPPEGANLISPHEAAVALHVRREDCDELSADLAKV